MKNELPLQTRLENIKSGLEQLRKLDPALKVASCAFHHKYLLNPPLSEERITAFEHKYQIALPEEYRLFLLHVGDGGAGPDYGLLPLERWTPRGQINRTFPHRQSWSPYEQPEWPPIDIPEGRSFGDEENFKNLWDGALRIGSAGCDSENLLIITGPERGHMWLSEMDNETGFMPYGGLEHTHKTDRMFPFYKMGDAGRVGFLDWYEHWLQMNLRHAQHGPK